MGQVPPVHLQSRVHGHRLQVVAWGRDRRADHLCRESCGVCGFLSPFNREEQEDKGLSYTDINSPTFDCGRDPPFCVRDGFSCETGKPSPCLNLTREETRTTTTTEPSLQDNSLDLRSDFFFAFTDFGNSYCSLIPITDKWALGAAHCYIDYSATKLDPKGMTLNYGTEFEEDIEFKKVYRHPNYQAETLYNDVAVLEFGRRTLANVAKTNTTPDCIDPGIDLTKQVGTHTKINEDCMLLLSGRFWGGIWPDCLPTGRTKDHPAPVW